jgi:Tol biopolymer transport system component
MSRVHACLIVLLLLVPACGRDNLYATGAIGDARQGPGADPRPEGSDSGPSDAQVPRGQPDSLDTPDTADIPDTPDTADTPDADTPEPQRSFSEPTAHGRAAQIYLPGFSPDGRWLVWIDVGEGIESGRLHVLDTHTGATRLAATSVVVITTHPVRFSPDSRHIAFRTSDGAHGSIDFGPIHVLKLDGDGPALRLADGAIRRSFRFTPDGERLVFNTMGGLFVHELDAAHTYQLADYARYSPYVPVASVLPMSADGRYLAYDNRRALHLVDFQTGADVVLAEPIEKYTPQFSEASDRISWVQGRGAAGRLHIRSLAGETEFVAPEGSAPRLNADWTRVAYLRGAVQSQGYRQAELRVTEVQGGTTHVLADKVDAYHYRFSPSGRDLVFLRGREASYAYTGELRLWDGRTTRVLDDSVFADWDHLDAVAFSPDGRWLVYQPATDYADRRTVARELATDRSMDIGVCVDFLRDGITGFGAPSVVAHCALFLPDGDVIYGTDGAATGVALTRRELPAGTREVVVADSNARPRVSPGQRLMATFNFTAQAEVHDMLATDLTTGVVHTIAANQSVRSFLASDERVAFVTKVDREQVVWVSHYDVR